ncbi:MAG TPA: dTDP-glucose 4,6-dehydratase [Alphaproteobacteria bacterium]|nr:dTDP-glucose 4,6-dehydratase [Alphaproteobacteria bacterium]
MKRIVVTGGAGFIGSHIVDHFCEVFPKATVVVLDKMTYAADIRNILHRIESRQVELVVGDICHTDSCLRAVEGADLVIHAAAESHVCNSFNNSFEFTRTNVLGTHCLMEAAKRAGVPKIIHVSTDEVYGEVNEGSAHEDSPLRPTSPYSASKAGAEMIISGYLKSFHLPVVTVRANNIFGTRQYPEKIIPKFTLSLLTGAPLTLHGSGQNRRHYLCARDFARALEILAVQGEIGGIYNIGTVEEYTNLEMASLLCAVFGLDAKSVITFVSDRPFNDFRYAVDWSKISALDWAPRRSLRQALPEVVRWYADNLFRYPKAGPCVRKPVLDVLSDVQDVSALRKTA